MPDGGAVAAHGTAVGAEIEAKTPQRAKVEGTAHTHQGGLSAAGAEVSLAAGTEAAQALAFYGFVGVVRGWFDGGMPRDGTL